MVIPLYWVVVILMGIRHIVVVVVVVVVVVSVSKLVVILFEGA